jgi:hypothetical protein
MKFTRHKLMNFKFLRIIDKSINFDHLDVFPHSSA